MQKDIEINPSTENLILNKETNKRVNGELSFSANEWQFQLQGEYLSNKLHKYISGDLSFFLASLNN